MRGNENNHIFNILPHSMFILWQREQQKKHLEPYFVKSLILVTLTCAVFARYLALSYWVALNNGVMGFPYCHKYHCNHQPSTSCQFCTDIFIPEQNMFIRVP